MSEGAARRRRSSRTLPSLSSGVRSSRGAGGGSAPAPSGRISRSELPALLSDADKEILQFLTEHRIATTIQVQQLLGMPERTARYRLERMKRLGFAGSLRPYAERGSAPHHWYPTKVADAWAGGAPVPQG